MKELLILGYALALVMITAGSPTDRGECCLEKTVGGVTYTFVEKEDTAPYSCLSDCVYRKKGGMGPKFCFAKGELEVQCEGFGRPNMSYNDERICDADLHSFLSADNNSTITIKCCKSGAKKTTCAGPDCLNTCEGNITCMIPVTNIEDSKQCETNEFFIAINKASCNKSANRIINGKSKPMCPGYKTPGFRNPECACCKYGFYTQESKCKYQCRCFGICSFFEFYFKGIPPTFISWCQDCPLTPTVSAPQGSGFSTNSMDTTDLALSSTPPTTDATNEPDATFGFDCGMCNKPAFAKDNDLACKCDCTCAYITGCSGFNANNQWSSCWSDYSFCCECSGSNNYSRPCPETCNKLNLNAIYRYPILKSTDKFQDPDINCTYTLKN